jgi:hypothetical protein
LFDALALVCVRCVLGVCRGGGQKHALLGRDRV